jgi:methylglutaconyl-CoA hydratase
MMTSSDVLKVSQNGPVLRLTMARPERRNSLSRALVAELHREFSTIAEGSATRVVVLAGEGPVFCSGADIGEFLEVAESGKALEDAEQVAALFAAIVDCPVPVLARVEGAAYGGGVGLVCAADIVIASEDAKFSLSEARLGLVPAIISPYVVAALGEREAKTRMLLASPFDANEALRMGLVHSVDSSGELDAAIETAISSLLKCAPGALAAIKGLPRQLRSLDPAAARAFTTGLLAERLASDETREGLSAFLAKRPPAWTLE